MSMHQGFWARDTHLLPAVPGGKRRRQGHTRGVLGTRCTPPPSSPWRAETGVQKMGFRHEMQLYTAVIVCPVS